MLTHMGEISKELKPPTRKMENLSKKKKITKSYQNEIKEKIKLIEEMPTSFLFFSLFFPEAKFEKGFY